MYVCPYCESARHELRPCCGEMQSEEFTDEVIALAGYLGVSSGEVQADFDAFVAKMENERALTDNGEGP